MFIGVVDTFDILAKTFKGHVSNIYNKCYLFICG